MLSSLKTIFSQPASNPQVIAVVIAIVVAVVLIVAFVLIGIALPGRGDEIVDADQRRARSRHKAAGCGLSLIIVVAGFLAATLVWYRTTSTNTYCSRTCHEMAAPSAAWSASSHDRIACVRCHEGSGWGAVARGVVMRASCLVAEVSHRPTSRFPVPESRCLECHASLLDAKMIARNGEPFTHKEVIAEGGTCKSCHGEQGHVVPRAKR